ncbi:hypothetical protein [Paraburkholderia sp. RL17-337-BIB-A]|uniref:hypothetical protein n=1 Tax=Paraburkholderia sp. RL17-337-BIB-A TaxID=3031636 RepID=UPI0038BB8686
MKGTLKAFLVSCALAAPAFAFAQSTNYQTDAQATQSNVAAQQSTTDKSVGGVALTGSSQAGSRMTIVTPGNDRTYSGHKSLWFGH